MKRETYASMTARTRKVLEAIPNGEKMLKVPTLVLAAVYIIEGFLLLIHQDRRLWLFMTAPALCFAGVTVLRKCINRKRPYDAFDIPPVGKHVPNKGKSMPSRHAASACAICLAILSLQPSAFLAAAVGILTILICCLRFLTGQHYISDVLAGVLFSTAVSLLCAQIPISPAFPFQ